MSRDEEIINASNELFKSVRGSKTYKIGFEMGVKWADVNTKSPWISVEKDLPCNHEELINTEYDKETVYVVVIGKDVIADTDCMEYNGKEWVWQKNSFFEPTHWFPIPKLPKIN